MLSVGNKIVCTKDMGPIKKDTICYITAITNEGIQFTVPSKGWGMMSQTEYEKYFKKWKVEWSEWKKSPFSYCEITPNGALKERHSQLMFRHNGKRVEVKFNELKASASCHLAYDNFDLETGLEMAKERLRKKTLETTKKNLMEYNGRVVVTKTNDIMLTVGKVYTFKNGLSYWDDGYILSKDKTKFKNFEDLRDFFYPGTNILEITE